MDSLFLLVFLLAASSCSASFLTNVIFEDYNPMPSLNDTDSLLRSCVDRKDYTALHSSMNAIKEYHDCYQKALEMLTGIRKATNKSSVPEMASAFCRTSRSVEVKCTETFVINVRPCVSDLDIDALQLYKNTAIAIQNYLCSGDSHQMMTDFFNTLAANVTECEREKWQCLRSYLQGAYHTSYGFLQLERFSLSPQGCRARREGLACMRQQSVLCEGDPSASVIDGFFNATIGAALPCFTDDGEQLTHR